MNKKDWKQIIVVFGIILFIAGIKDLTDLKKEEENCLYRQDAGGEEQTVEIIAKIDGISEQYTYHLNVEALEITKEEAKQYIALAKEVIEEDFHEQKTKLTIKDYYVSDKVEAEWIFSPEEYVNKDGSILFQNLPDEGGVLQVTVLLTCGAYEEIYSFPVWLDLGLLSQQDKLRIKLEKELELLLEQKEVKTIPLPTHIDGKAVKWSEKRGFLFFKLLFLELIAIALLVLSARQKEKQEDEKRKAEIEITYADVVNQLVILLRAGMTTRQAWSQIAKQQKARNQLESTVVYEAIQRLSMRMKEGEKERLAYELFAKEVDVTCYRRLMRVLAANLEKGSSDLSCYLEEESRNAYEERILIAKKKGEEISTKMLLPLIMMMVLVMAIVLIPAMISFSG